MLQVVTGGGGSLVFEEVRTGFGRLKSCQEARREVKTKFNGLQLTQISFDLEDIKSYLVAADEVEGEECVERGRREEAVAAVTLEVGFQNISQLTRR